MTVTPWTDPYALGPTPFRTGVRELAHSIDDYLDEKCLMHNVLEEKKGLTVIVYGLKRKYCDTVVLPEVIRLVHQWEFFTIWSLVHHRHRDLLRERGIPYNADQWQITGVDNGKGRTT